MVTSGATCRLGPILWATVAICALGDGHPIASAGDAAARTETGAPAGPVVVGRVTYRGPVPSPTEVPVERDSDVCGTVMKVATISVDPSTHGVRDAIVHVGSGQGMGGNGPTHTSVLQNKRCVFYPRVEVLQAGGEIEAQNDDPVMHNTNISVLNSTVLNVALVPGGHPIKKPLRREGLHVVTCNVHKFMKAYRYVFSDPFFDRTNDRGEFRIQGLSPGPHTISVWHETLGELRKEIHVPPKGTLDVEFEFQ